MSAERFPLTGQKVCITGAAQGLGAGLARAFAAAGAELVLMDVATDAMAALAATLAPAKVHTITVDLSDAEATRNAATEMLLQTGRIDCLIHNAAILKPLPFAQTPFALHAATMNVGIQAGFILSQAVWEGMVQGGGGALVFVSSQSGIKGFENEASYCAAKHALEGFSKCLAMEGAAHGILSCTITPGKAMRTPMSDQNYTAEMKTQWVEPDLLAPAFLHIAATRDPALSGERLNAWHLSSPQEA